MREVLEHLWRQGIAGECRDQLLVIALEIRIAA
jgi:hypothetical protein